jgi:hypothetical protein
VDPDEEARRLTSCAALRSCDVDDADAEARGARLFSHAKYVKPVVGYTEMATTLWWRVACGVTRASVCAAYALVLVLVYLWPVCLAWAFVCVGYQLSAVWVCSEAGCPSSLLHIC